MLKFDSLEIIGFKSFAEKTRVSFHDRVTAIIGPNGCGKSNLADAIGWVLGEQSARLLRGTRMEDIIFSGTSKRKPSGFAEVTLRLLKTDSTPIRLDGLELHEDIIEISRKLYRSEESIYSINQRHCRLKDIQQLLEAGGLGYASYALIEQGRIDSVLNSKPIDRRSIIEEAAQIIGYKARRRNAELKLEMARQNLLRVNDITAEIERQLRSLKRQAAKARRYRELKEQFRDLLRKKFALESQQLETQLDSFGERYTTLKNLEEALGAELVAKEHAYRESLEYKDRLDQEIAALRRQLSESRVELERLDSAIHYHREQIESLHKQVQLNDAEQESLNLALAKLLEEIAALEEDRLRLQREEQHIEGELTRQKLELESRKRQKDGTEERLEQVRQELVQLSAENVSLRNAKEQIQQQLQNSSSRKLRLERDHEQAVQQQQESSRVLSEKTETVQRIQQELESAILTLERQNGSRRDLENKVEDLKTRLNQAQNQLIANRERLESLQELELKHSQYSESVQQLLNHLSQVQTVQSCGTLADFIETHPQYEQLVEGFLSEELEYVLVDTIQEAVQAASEVKNLRSGKCTFLSLRLSNGFGRSNGRSGGHHLKNEDGVLGTLGEIVIMKPEVRDAFNRVLPQQASAVVVANLPRALELAHSYPDSMFVTLEGETLSPAGLLSATSGQSQKLGLLSLKRQKRELENKVLQLKRTESQLLQQLKHEQTLLDETSRLLTATQAEVFRLEKESVALTHQCNQWQRDDERHLQALKTIREELSLLENEKGELLLRSQDLEIQLQAFDARRADIEQTLGSTHQRLQQLKLDFEESQERFHLAGSDRKILEERRLSLESRHKQLLEQEHTLEERLRVATLIKNKNESRIVSLEEELRHFNKKTETGREELSLLESKLLEHDNANQAWRQAYQQLEEELSRLRERRNDTQGQRSQLEVGKARVETQLQTLAEQCLDQVQMSLAELAAQTDVAGLQPENVVGPYADLKARLEEFGPINMTALEEYQENEERFNFLTAQRQDIEKSIEDTTLAIQEINRRSREKFRHAFDAINTSFKEVFQALFGGGDCGMQLLDDDDLLESGIEIFAQPPGKKLQSVHLLSGGEKAMTALALLVALCRYRPSQFCVLDEVDAPLDDANVGRFGDLIRSMSDQTQFIIITHNKKTMENAQTLYGVTMEEAGVSQLVSVHFDD
ncbi:MAG: chromosome segregation protein SMC [Acidobacteria bacterium]|nr:chromosome segregation protein SMC [Acidobacteriota bacterium]